jgi:hypothetical protein
MASIIQTAELPRDAVPAEKLGPVHSRQFPPLCIADNGKVRIGGQGPIFRAAAIFDAGKVRIGGQGPIFR